MKICIDARFFGNENGGLGRYTMQLLGELAKLGTKNTYYVLLRKKYFESESFPANFQKVLCEIPHYSLKEQLVLPSLIYSLKVDLVHFPHFNAPILYFGKRVVTIHDLLMHQGVGKKATTLPTWKYLVKRLGYRFVFDMAVNSANQIIVPSNYVLNELARKYPKSKQKSKVIYEGVTSLPVSKSAKVKGKILYVGNAYPHKNVESLLDSVSILLKEGVRVSLTLVVPKDNFVGRLESKVKSIGLGASVSIKSFLTDQQLSQEYMSAEVFAYPSFSEGFGLQGLEALASKCLFCCSDIGIFREIYGDTAMYFDPSSPKSIAESILRSLNLSTKEKSAIFSEFERIKKKYDWGEMAKKTIKVYESSLGI